MTFSTETRLELARLMPTRRCCAVSELAAMLMSEGISISSADKLQESPIQLCLGHPALARKVYHLVRKIHPPAAVQIRRNESSPRRRAYVAEITTGQEALASTIQETVTRARDGVSLPKRRCCRRAFLRGAFLCRGSVSAPSKHYHFEIVVDAKEVAESLVACLGSLGQEERVSRRKGAYLVYLKESESIVDVLSLMGAHQALLELENVRIVKGMRNRVNRLVNSETANVDKTVNAALSQLEAIRLIDDAQGLSNLPGPLVALARARQEFPYASLRELGELMSPKVSKSSVSYRMRRLMSVAETLQRARGGS